MFLERHVTLRCLVDDLTSGWNDADEYRAVKILRPLIIRRLNGEITDAAVAAQLRAMPRLNVLNHPLVRQFDASFGPDEDPSSRENISGLTAPHWWKQKTMQWRGAATDHSIVGDSAVWLCAGGTRRQGDRDDFYAGFMRDVTREGPGRWLPGDEDRLAVMIDEKILSLDAWKLQVHCVTLALLAEALKRPGETIKVPFSGPSRILSTDVIGELSLSAESVDVDGIAVTEVFLVTKIRERGSIVAVDVATQIARAALHSDAEEWHSTTYTADAFAFSAIIDPVARIQAEELVETGFLPLNSAPANLRLGLRAHYSQKDGIVSAQVNGSSILSLCGYWFVPISDHENVKTCSECVRRYEQFPDS